MSKVPSQLTLSSFLLEAERSLVSGMWSWFFRNFKCTSTSLFLSPICIPLSPTLTHSVTQRRQQGPDLIFFYCIVIPASPRVLSPLLPCHHLFMTASKHSARIHSHASHATWFTLPDSHTHTRINVRILVAGGVQVCDKPGEPCLLYKYTQRQSMRGGVGGLTGFSFNKKSVGAAPDLSGWSHGGCFWRANWRRSPAKTECPHVSSLRRTWGWGRKAWSSFHVGKKNIDNDEDEDDDDADDADTDADAGDEGEWLMKIN